MTNERISQQSERQEMKANGIIGIRNMRVEHAIDAAVKIDLELVAMPGYDPHHLLDENWRDLFPGDAVVKCQSCGQWGARRTVCKHCGDAIS